ncbi:uncharacterized protein LOC107819362 [Nicotiana tabacum]|uniref:Uncharacterized protein LOC107819362 n=2 Tax=Nicotiana tabacum TaxID=4097 RepID=A0AC58U4D6_TOBAC
MFQKGSTPPPQLTKSFRRLNSPSSSSSLHSDAHPSKIKCSNTNAKVLRLVGWYDSTDGCMVKEYISLVNMYAKVSGLFTDMIVLMGSYNYWKNICSIEHQLKLQRNGSLVNN